ncbi:retrotransposon protein, putative, ty1-copia subclass [Tanacetum coccineum]
MVRSMMNLTTLPLSFWDYALESTTRILNMVPTKKVDKTPYELWYGKVPNLSYLKVWGCKALVKRDTPDKLEQRLVKCIFIGYPKETMGYYFYFPPENKIVVAMSERTHRAPNRLCLNVEVEEHSLGDLGEPANYKAAMLDPESKRLVDAMNAEMQSMIDNMVWVLVDLPPNWKTVGSKWIFKKNTDMDGNVHTLKARLMAKGYTQNHLVASEETSQKPY